MHACSLNNCQFKVKRHHKEGRSVLYSRPSHGSRYLAHKLLLLIHQVHALDNPTLRYVTTTVSDKELSKVVYAEVVSERADSKPTLLSVISRLQQVFLNQLQQKYVVLVGDGKTYQILKEIHYEYSSELQWLILYPGDWHILLNYQRALMKPYTDAGLTSLGKVSGHRGETLPSIV